MATHSSVLAWEIHGHRSLWAAVHGVAGSGTTERLNNNILGSSLAVQWLGRHTFTAKGLRSILGRELRSHKLQGVTKKKKINNLDL